MVVVLGFVSLTGMQTDLLPNMNLPYLLVITTYPGASPEQVESDVTQPLENSLSTLNGVKNVTSQSNENYSLVILEYQDDTDMDSAMVKASTAVNQLSDSLPDMASTPTLMEMSPDMMATQYVAVDYEGMDIYELSEMYCRMFAGAALCGNNCMFAVFLRGGGTGGAVYHIYSDQPIVSSAMSPSPIPAAPQIAYNSDLIFQSGSTKATVPLPPIR